MVVQKITQTGVVLENDIATSFSYRNDVTLKKM